MFVCVLGDFFLESLQANFKRLFFRIFLRNATERQRIFVRLDVVCLFRLMRGINCFLLIAHNTTIRSRGGRKWNRIIQAIRLFVLVKQAE